MGFRDSEFWARFGKGERFIGGQTAIPGFAFGGFFGEVIAGEMVFEGFDCLMDELTVGRRVPAGPEASVTVEAAAVESRLLASFGGGGGGVGVDGAEDKVGEDFLVFEGEDGGEG